jgi:outer membrane protein assembly factor BamB
MKPQSMFVLVATLATQVFAQSVARDASTDDAGLDGGVDDATGTDILAEVEKANSRAFASPPTEFRAGHVSPRKLEARRIEHTDGGFRVSFPSQAPITTPAIEGDLVITSGGFHGKELYAVNAKTGALKWGLDLDDDGPSAPACSDGVCAFNTESCTLFVIEAATGKLLWSKWLGDPLTSAPTIANGLVYASYPVGAVAGKAPRPPGMSHALAAFELRTGKIVWQRWLDGDVMSSPVATKDELWASSFAGTVYRFNAATGTVLSARRARATSAPTVVGDAVLFSKRSERAGDEAQEAIATTGRVGGMGKTYAKKASPYLDARKQRGTAQFAGGQALDSSNGFAGGAPATANAGVALSTVGKGSVSTMQSHQGSRVLPFQDKTMSTMGDEVVCDDARTGQRLWAMKLKGDLLKEGGALAAPPAAAGDSLIIGTLSSEVLRVNPTTGEVITRWKMSGPIRNQPIVSGGWIYVGTENGQLIGIDTTDAKLTGWSQWGGNAARTGAL